MENISDFLGPVWFWKKLHPLCPSSSSRDTKKPNETDVRLLAICDRNDGMVTFAAMVAGLYVYNEQWWPVEETLVWLAQHCSTVSTRRWTVNRPERRLTLAVRKYGKLIIDLKAVIFCISWDSLVLLGCTGNKSRSIFRRYSLFPPSRRSSQ